MTAGSSSPNSSVRPVLVEISATWCPPCRSTLRWLGSLKKEHGDRLSILTLSVETDEEAVRKVANDLGLPLFWAMGTPDVVKAFGDVAAVPTLLLFDGRGEAAGALYGTPPGPDCRRGPGRDSPANGELRIRLQRSRESRETGFFGGLFFVETVAAFAFGAAFEDFIGPHRLVPQAILDTSVRIDRIVALSPDLIEKAGRRLKSAPTARHSGMHGL